MKKVAYFLLFYVFLISQAMAQQTLPPELIRYADLVVLNGKVLTVDKNFTIAEAVAVRDGRILAVGSSVEIQRFAGPNTKKLDASGKSVIPGAIDGNSDNSYVGGDLYKETMVNGKVIRDHKVGGKNVTEVLANVKKLVDQAEPGTSVSIRVEEDIKSMISMLTAKDLDKIAPKNSLIVNITSSEGIVNTAMLEKAFAAGLRRDIFGVVRDANGNPTGQLFGSALFFIGSNLKDWPEITEEIFKEQEQIINSRLSTGVTTLTGHGSGLTVTLLSQFFHQGRLNARFRPDLDFVRQNPLADQFLRRVPNLLNFSLGDGMVRIVAAAIGPVDGGSDAGDVMTNEPKLRVHPQIGGGLYGRSKWTGTEWTGKQFADLTEKEKRETDWNTIQLLRKHGWPIGGIHNMGSGATKILLEALLEAEKQPDIKVHKVLARNSLDHNLIWDEKSIALAKQLGDKVAYGLAEEVFKQRIIGGEEALLYQYGEKIHTMQPVKDLLQAGLNIQIEGSSPRKAPMTRIQYYVTRRDKSGRVWGKDQAIDRKEALRCVTINAAKFVSEEDMLGSIEKGKYADLVILNGDYMSLPDDKIETLKPVMTIVGGKVVYEAK